MFYIYKITNKINNKCYVGITKNVKQRWQSHSNKSKIENEQRPLPQAMKKHGLENFTFEVIETTDSANAARLKEIEYIKTLNSLWTANGYNISPGGALPTDDQIMILKERMLTKNPMSELRFNKGSFKPGHKPQFTDQRRENHSKVKLGCLNPMHGNPQASKHLNEVTVACEHCGIVTTRGNIKRWHGDNCKAIQCS